ncbi:palmitoyltransferase ZDHHC12-B-like isoform X1 [Scyliorhinus canicula]|uniref:palmitoyltransferase ZDHHC12-B-like isoform X1 n=1 Tax=Scyliorhinus canicula TaxID=7830 RepID=UPI0018F5B9A2|nr:palmitoyltransferase ZDHHC12-B-like isoform X1 [Scyliorhinus canicula]
MEEYFELCEADVELLSERVQQEAELSLSTGIADDIFHHTDLIPSKFSYLLLLLWDVIYGSQKRSRIAIFIYVLIIVGWLYPTYIFMIVSMGWKEHPVYHSLFILSNICMWFYNVNASLSDPGNLVRYTTHYEEGMRQFIEQNLDSDHLVAANVCHTCQLLQPLRTVHCSATNQCVRHFDHYCLLIYNAVGYKNRASFFLFLVLLVMNCWMAAFIAATWFHRFGLYLPILAFFLAVLVSAFGFSLQVSFTLTLAMMNLTAYEVQHCRELAYLKRRCGYISNPFQRGVKLNLLEYFHFIEPLNYEEIQKHQQQNWV